MVGYKLMVVEFYCIEVKDCFKFVMIGWMFVVVDMFGVGIGEYVLIM